MKAFYRLFYYISIVLTSILAGVTIAGAFVGNAAPDSFQILCLSFGLMLPILFVWLILLLSSTGRSVGGVGFSSL